MDHKIFYKIYFLGIISLIASGSVVLCRTSLKKEQRELFLLFKEICRRDVVYISLSEEIFIDYDKYQQDIKKQAAKYGESTIIASKYVLSEKYIYPTYVTAVMTYFQLNKGAVNLEFKFTCQIMKGILDYEN